MGGAAAFVTISSKGEIDSTMAYNSNMASLSINYELINENDPVKRDVVIKSWMEENQKYMDKQYNRPGFAPSNYGLIIIDNLNKRILDHQGYTSLCRLNLIHLEMIANGSISGKLEDVMYEWWEMEKFLKAGKLIAKLRNKGVEENIDLSEFENIEEITHKVSEKNNSVYLYFDLNGWDYIDFEKTYHPNGLTMRNFYEYCFLNYENFLTEFDLGNWEQFLKENAT